MPVFASAIGITADAAADDSDKSITVPAGKEWLVCSIWAELVTTATVGNRVMRLEIQDDAAAVIFRRRTGSNQAASTTQEYVWIPAGASREANGRHEMSLPNPCILPAGYVIRILDEAAIAAAADDLTVRILREERTVV
jgi:hypothetical protein